jgi:thiamine kinase-like enzyme
MEIRFLKSKLFYILIFSLFEFQFIFSNEISISDDVDKFLKDNYILHYYDVQRLSGLTNKNFLITSEDGNKYVVRQAGCFTDIFINRASELNNSKEAFYHGFNPAFPLHFDINTGIQLTLYVENLKTLSFQDFYQAKTMQKIAIFLKEIHDSTMKIKNEVDFFALIEKIKILIESKSNIPLDLLLIFNNVMNLKEIIHFFSFKKTPIHGDPVPGNFCLLSEKLYIFDWEHSRLADPAWDLAFLSCVMGYDYDLDFLLVSYYDKENFLEILKKINFFKPIIECWLGLWGLLKYLDSDSNLEKNFFYNFSVLRFEKCKIYLNDVIF